MYSFKLICADTDSITVCKPDQSNFSKEEVDKLTIELNSFFEEGINWEFEFNLPTMIVFKAKNYVLHFNDGTVKLKGSALKDAKKPAILKEMCLKMVQSILDNRDDFTQIYEEYVQKALNVKDIKPWSSRKTISEKVINAQRTTEQKIKDAIVGTEYVEGDRVYTFFMPDGSLQLVERFNGVYDKSSLLHQLYSATQLFDVVLPVDDLFKNYSLAKYFKDLCPEEAQLKKQQAAIKRKEAKDRKALQTSKEDVMMTG